MINKMLRFLALGDSYTIGEGIAEVECWPIQLTHHLRQAGINIAAPHIIATTGWTTAGLTAGIAATPPQPPFDLVTLLIGVNNQYRGLPLNEYRCEFTHLLQQAITFAHNNPQHVIVLSIPDWSGVPFAANHDRDQIRADIVAFNNINRQQAVAHNTHYANITSLSQRADDPSLTAADGLHPSAKLYTQWVKAIIPIAHQILRR